MVNSSRNSNTSAPNSAHPLMAWLLERSRFIRAFISNPAAIGAITPSSSALAAAITASVQPKTSKVLELGCGTGAFTREMLRRGVAPADLVLVEQDAQMCVSLRAQFPKATVLQASAQALSRYRYPHLRDIETTICGLPLLNMSRADHLQLLSAVFEAMQPSGTMYLFTYGLRCPVCADVLEACGLSARKERFVALNLPPACVYRIARHS